MTSDKHTGSGLWARLGARIYDPFLALGEQRGMAGHRRALLAGAEGRVLELGAGTGLNLVHYPVSVRELVLSEPDDAMRRALERRVARSGPVGAAGSSAGGGAAVRRRRVRHGGLDDGAVHGRGRARGDR